jgi:putative transcriptional regulator
MESKDHEADGQRQNGRRSNPACERGESIETSHGRVGGSQMKTEWMCQGHEEREELHYNWCGLDDVYLRSGYERIHTDEGDDVVIHNMDGLHRAIAEYLARHKKALTGKEVRFLRHEMDLSQRELGKILRVTDQTVARWEKEHIVIPDPEEMLLRVSYLLHVAHELDMRELANSLADVDDSATNKKVFEESDDGTWQFAAAA